MILRILFTILECSEGNETFVLDILTSMMETLR